MDATDQDRAIGQAARAAAAARRAAPLLVVLACCAAYANTVQNGFVFDDLAIVRDNPRLESWGGVGGLLRASYWEREDNADRLWRPSALASFWLDARVFGKQPAGFHLVNLALHAGVSLLLLRLARSMGLGQAGALCAALAFALHPIHTDAVSSVVGRCEVLSALFYLAALLALLRIGRGGGWRAGAAAGAWLFSALASKENAATFPLSAALAAALFWRKSPPRSALWTAIGAIAAALGVYMALRLWALGAMLYEPAHTLPGLLYGAGLETRILTAAAVFARYAWLFLWPASLSADYSFDAISLVSSWRNPTAWVGLGVVSAAAAAAWALRRRSPAAAFGLAFYLAAFALTSNFLIPIKTLMAERLAYLPSVGLALAFGAAAQALWDRSARHPGSRLALAAIFGVLCLAWEARTVIRNLDWETNGTLFASVVREQPRCARAYYNLGDVRRVDDGDFRGAIVFYEKALAIQPEDPGAWLQIGNCHFRLNRFSEAAQAYKRALTLDPANVGIRTNLDRARKLVKKR